MKPGSAPAPDALVRQLAGLRALARRLVSDQHLAEDAVQDACVAALERPPRSEDRLGAWLRTATRFVVSKELRSRSRRARRERAAARSEEVDAADESAARAELLRGVVETVLALPEPYRRTVLARYFEDLPPRRIAAREGVPVETVRTRLTRAHERLRTALAREHGEERWALGLAALLGEAPHVVPAPAGHALDGPAGAPFDGGAETAAAGELGASGAAGGAAVLGGVGMALKTKLALAAAALAALGVGWLAREELVAGRTAARTALAGRAGRLEGAPAPEIPAGDAGRSSSPRSLVAAAPPPAPGAAEEDPAEEAEPAAEPFRARVLVVDAGERPVEGATVWCSENLGYDAAPVGVTDADGRLELETEGRWITLSARAPGRSPSGARVLQGAPGRTGEARLLLGPGGGALAGIVLLPSGGAATEARVRVAEHPGGPGRVPLAGGSWGEPPQAAVVPVDATGAFRIEGLEPGVAEVQARAPGMSPWSGTVTVRAGEEAALEIALLPGVSIGGRATDENGAPLPGMFVALQGATPFTRANARTDEQGLYRLEGLAAGSIELRAFGQHRAHAKIVLEARPGDRLVWDPVLAGGLAIVGRVVYDDESPAGGAHLLVRWEDDGTWWSSYAQADEEGAFRIGGFPDVPVDLEVRLDLAELETKQAVLSRPGLRPGGGEELLVISRAELPSAFLVGWLVGAEEETTLFLGRLWEDGLVRGMTPTPVEADGSFRIGPLAPDRYSLSWLGDTPAPEEVWRGELTANETRDLGEIAPYATGTVEVTVLGVEPEEEHDLHFLDFAHRPSWSFRVTVEGPGPHELTVRVGTWALAEATDGGHRRFEVVEGETTRIDVQKTEPPYPLPR